MLNIRLTPVVKNLIILNVVVFLLQMSFRRSFDITGTFSLYHFSNVNFYPFQFLTYMFLHGDYRHLIFNMLPLVFFAPYVEELVGSRKFLLLYLICGLGAALLQAGIQHYDYINIIDRYSLEIDPARHWNALNNSKSFKIGGEVISRPSLLLGASGAVYGILMASALYFPNATVVLFPIPIPLKLKYLVAGYAFMDIFAIVRNNQDGVAHYAHIGGMIFAYIMIWYWRKYPKY